VPPAPLTGVRVLDFGRYIAGPFCAAVLADFGADVIRVERLSGGEDRFPFALADAAGACFLQMNRNKRGMTFNPAKAGAQQVLSRLVAKSDVVVANLPADTRRAMGLDYDNLVSIKPDIILAAICAFGEQGPYANRVGFDAIGQAMSGAAYLSGFGHAPTKSYVSWVDFMTGLFGAFGTLAALRERANSGRGQQVAATLFGSAITAMNYTLMEEFVRQSARSPTGNRSQFSCPGDTHRTRDGWITLQTIGPALFERWCQLVAEPEFLEDARFASDQLRVLNGAILSERTQAWCSRLTNAEALAQLAEARIPAGPIYSPREVLNDPHVAATDMFTSMSYPGIEAGVPLMMSALTLAGAPPPLRRRAPTLGEHTDESLGECGFSAAEIAGLRTARIV
jgi:crotonobetainyl-CoA:carnitine CoA-transferase CaiB-like acyl-CoA transferase